MPALKKRKLLILDDNASFAESLSDVLSREGFETRWSPQAAAARKLAVEFHPEVLIVDVNLLTVSGIDVAQQFCRDRLVGFVVFLTGSVDMDQSDIPAELQPIAVVLHKPVEKEDLLDAISRLSRKLPGAAASS